MEEVRVLGFCSEPRALSADASGAVEAEAEGGGRDAALWGAHGLWLRHRSRRIAPSRPPTASAAGASCPRGAWPPGRAADPPSLGCRCTRRSPGCAPCSQRVLDGCTPRLELAEVAAVAAAARQPQLCGGFQKASELAARPPRRPPQPPRRRGRPARRARPDARNGSDGVGPSRAQSWPRRVNVHARAQAHARAGTERRALHTASGSQGACGCAQANASAGAAARAPARARARTPPAPRPRPRPRQHSKHAARRQLPSRRV